MRADLCQSLSLVLVDGSGREMSRLMAQGASMVICHTAIRIARRLGVQPVLLRIRLV